MQLFYIADVNCFGNTRKTRTEAVSILKYEPLDLTAIDDPQALHTHMIGR